MRWRNVLLFAAGAVCQAQTSAPTTQTIAEELHKGRYSEAKPMIEAALKKSPRDERLWTLHGFALSHLGGDKSALTSYQHALELSPNYLPALEGAAEIEYNASDQRAVPLLKKILLVHPTDQTTHAMLASLAVQRHDCATAAEEFALSTAQIASQPAALEQYGSCLVKLRQTAEAIRVFQRLADLQPENRKARYNLAVVESLAGRHEDVIATLRAVVAKNPGDGDALELLSEAYEAASDTPHAVQTLRAAIIANPDVPRYYLDFANLSFVHSSFQVGVDILNAGLKRMPSSAPLYLARGILFVQMGKYDQADTDFAEAERLDPKLHFGSSARGLAQLQDDNLDEAENTVREHLRKSPNDAFLHYLLAETLARKGGNVESAEFKEAIRTAQKAIELQPNFALARDVLARLYLQQGRIPQAIEQSRLALKEDPTDQTAVYHLIQALRKTNDTRELPALAKKLAEIREQARAKEAAEHRYALVEPGPGGAKQ
jgi:tetratricopeptide (TPR) repeat protein